jgi:ATP-binding cassette, subfamily B, bacterial
MGSYTHGLFQENVSMWKNLSLTSFGQGPAGTARTCWTTVKLAWKACPVLLVGVLLLFGVESGLTPLQLALSRAVIDKLAAPLGHTAVLDSLVTHVSLTAWIVLTLTVMTLGQLISPLTALLQSQASDRLSGYVTEQVMQVWLLKWLVDVLSAPLSLTGGYAGVLDGELLVVLAVLYLLTLLIPAGLQPLHDNLEASIKERVVVEVDRRIMQASARLVDLQRIEAPSFHDEVELIRQSSYEVPIILGLLSLGPGTILTLGGLLLLLGQIHPALPLLLLLVGISDLRAKRRLETEKYRSLAANSRVAREMEYYTRLALETTVAHEVRAFGLGDFLPQRYRERRERAMAKVQRLRWHEFVQAQAYSGLTALVLAGAFSYTALQIIAGHLQTGDIALYLGAVVQAQNKALALGNFVASLHRVQLHLRGLFDFLDGARPAIALQREGQGTPAPARFEEGIELRDVHFRYPGGSRDREVLQGMSARLPAGKVTALVGVNGAGKSTLVKLLTRMYDPVSGLIVLDGASLASYDLASLRGRMAVVYQDFAHFALTLHENITAGDIESDPDFQRVEQAAHRSGADQVAAKLPQGYATELTRRFEGGVELSGGEWQKVALARSFLREAALVILDEPASALDAEAEYQLFQHFRELTTGKTALLISHRLSTVRMADQILVLDGGRIVEAGSHADLMARGGQYASLYEMQAGRYR